MISTSARVCLFAVLAAAFDASAQRISLPDFSGRGAGSVRTQLVNQLCDTADCVAATKVTVGGKPDMKKAKRELLQYFVTGVVAKKGRATTLLLTVVPVRGGAKVKRTFTLEKNGTLSRRNLQAAVDLVRGVIGPGEPSARPEPTPEPTEPTPAPAPYRPEPSEPTEPSEPVAERPAEPPPPPPTSKRGAKPIFLALELGVDVLNRQLTYANATSNNVREYGLTAFPMPVLKLEFYPLALGRNDALSGLGLEGAFGIAPYLKSRRESTEEAYPTTAMRVDVGLRWRIVVSPTFPLVVTPFLGLKVQSFTVSPSTTGTLDGLPNINFVGLRAGLALDVPLVNNVFYIVGRFAILPMFSSGEIISANYFKAGSTFGFEAGAGVAVQLAKFLQIRGTFEFTQYGLTFKPLEGDTYIATGATDRYLGGNLALRFQF